MLKNSIVVVLLAVVAFFIAVLMGWVNINGASRKPAAEQPPVAARQSPVATSTNTPPAADDKKTIHVDEKLKVFPPCYDAKPGGPEEVVRSIYDDFPWGESDSIEFQPKKVLSKYFVPDLVELLLKYEKCRESDAGGCPIIDTIWNQVYTETPYMTDFNVCAMNSSRNFVRVQLRNAGDPEIMLYKLKQAGSEWKISDVIYVTDFNPVDPGKSDGRSLVDSLSGN